MSDETGLLSCPFCGTAPEVFPSGDGTGVMIECANEKCRVHPCTSWYGKGVAFAAWNTRAALAKAERAPGAEALTFDAFRQANVTRCLKWHPAGIQSWSPSDWLTAMAGELGELASLVKMRNRERDGLPGNKFSPTQKQVADEVADVLTYLDLFAAALGIDLGAAAVEKFNEVSERIGFPDRIALAALQSQPAGGDKT